MTRCLGCMEPFDGEMTVCPHCGYTVGAKPEYKLQLEPGTVLNDRYLVGRSLGYGSFGITYLAWDGKLQRKVAIKEFLPSQFATRSVHRQELKVSGEEKYRQQFEAGKKKFQKEGSTLAQTNGIDGVVRMYESFEENNTAYIVMEYLRGETLAARLKREGTISEQEAKALAVPLLQALQEVHDKGIIHRDIAPDNIFLAKDDQDQTVVKLIDFGAARFSATSYSKSLTMIIKPGFSPEEQYRSDGQQGPYTDVYALAAVLYNAVTGERPPAANERRVHIAKKGRDMIRRPRKLNKSLSENFEIALLNALAVRIEDRTQTAEAFLEELLSFEPLELHDPTIKRLPIYDWPLWAQISVPLASAAALGLLVFVIVNALGIGKPTFILPEGMTRVPDFVTATYDEATAWAQEHQLLLENGGSEYAPGVMSDLVLRQSVQNGEIVEVNTLVNVVVSTGEEHYPIPDVTGMRLDAAKTAMESTGLVVETNEVSVPGLAEGCVANQDLEPFTQSEAGKVVTLNVNMDGTGKEGKVPNLVGLFYSEALDAANQAGAVVCVKERIFTADEPAGKVMGQSINAEEDLKEGDVIELAVSIPWREFEMPNLLYKDQATATQLLRNIGLKVSIDEEMNEALAKGLVSAQDVTKDTTVKPGDTVTLRVSSGGRPVALPNVKGMTEEEARKVLTDAALVVRVEYDYDAAVAEGSVISQSIEGGNEAQRGTAITLIVCSTEGLVQVENVVGMTSDNAQNALKAQGLKVQINENYNSAAKGTVTAQLPAAGSVQKPDTVIVITVSKGPAPVAPSSAPAAQTTKPNTPTSAPTVPTTPPPAATPYVAPGPWSSWSTNRPSGDYDVEQKTQYRYRDKETTSSTSSSLSGWTQTGSSTSAGDWGNWSGWSSSSVSANDNRQVETRSVYHYYYFVCSNCGAHMHGYGTCYTWAGGCGQNTIPESSYTPFRSTVPYSSTSDFHGTGVNYAYTDNGLSFAYIYSSNQYYVAPETQYRYRERSVVTTYYYERWGNWSAWQDSSISSSSNRQVETQTVYRYRTKGTG